MQFLSIPGFQKGPKVQFQFACDDRVSGNRKYSGLCFCDDLTILRARIKVLVLYGKCFACEWTMERRRKEAASW